MAFTVNGSPAFAFQGLVKKKGIVRKDGLVSLRLELVSIDDPDGACREARAAQRSSGALGEISCYVPVKELYVYVGDYLEGTAVVSSGGGGSGGRNRSLLGPLVREEATYHLCTRARDDRDELIMPPRVIVAETEETVRRFLEDQKFGSVSVTRYIEHLRTRSKNLDGFREQVRRPGALRVPESKLDREMNADRQIFLAMSFDAVRLTLDAANLNSHRVRSLIKRIVNATRLTFPVVVAALRRWHKMYVMRIFYSAGMRAGTVRSCCRSARVDLLDAADILYDNPYRFLCLTMTESEQIATRLRLHIPDEEIAAAEVARELNRIMGEEKATCLTLDRATELLGDALLRAAPRLSNYGISLDSRYRAIYDIETLLTEREVAEWIAAATWQPGPLESSDLGNSLRLARDKGDVRLLAADSDTDEEERGDHHYDDLKRVLSTLEAEQGAAVLGLASHRFALMTGRGGTGKTTVIRALVRMLESQRIPFALCSFSGKAVSRMSQATRRQAFTIHSLLMRSTESIPTLHTPVDTLKKYDPVVIIDEISMVPTVLLGRLIHKFHGRISALLVVGDNEQLPSIQPGPFMRELLASRVAGREGLEPYDREKEGLYKQNAPGIVPVYHLRKNHRAALGTCAATLQENVESLNNLPALPTILFEFNVGPGFGVFTGELDVVERLLRVYHESGKDIHDLAIVTPYNDVAAQVNDLVRSIFFAETLENEFGQDGREWNSAERNSWGEWYIGARVMHTKNNYTYGVMNGDEGVIVEFLQDGDTTLVVVEYDDLDIDGGSTRSPPEHPLLVGFTPCYLTPSRRALRPVRYVAYMIPPDAKHRVEDTGEEDSGAFEVSDETLEYLLNDEKKTNAVPPLYTSSLAISFCATVHKYQGSERDHILAFFPWHRANEHMLSREIVNVAITRARKTVNVIGDIPSVTRLATMPEPPRFSLLKDRLRDALSQGPGARDDEREM